MAYDPLGLDQPGTEAPVAGYDPLGLGPEEKKPSYLEAAKTGLKEGLAGAMRMYEIPSRGILERTGLAAPGTFASELLKPTEEEEKRVGELGIPGQIVRGAAGLPGAALKYGPLMKIAPALGLVRTIPGILGTAGVFAGERAAEELAAGKRPSPKELGEEALIGGIFRGIEPLGRLAKAAILSGTFSTQAFGETYAQTKDLKRSLEAAIAPGVIGAGLGVMSGGKPGERPIPRAGEGETRQIPPIPESRYQMGTPGWPRPEDLPYPVVPYERGGPVTEMVWNPRTQRFEAGDYFRVEPGGPFEPPPAGPPGGLTWTPTGSPPPPPDWVREGREFPPPQYPPVPYVPRPTGRPSEPIISPTPAPTPAPAPPKAPGVATALATDRQMTTVRENAADIGGLSVDLIKRWTGLGTKRANAILEDMVAAGEIEGGLPGEPYPWKIKGVTPPAAPSPTKLPGDAYRFAGEIHELWDLVKRGEPGRKIGLEAPVYGMPTTASWGSSYPPFMSDKGWTKVEVLEAIDRGMRGDKFDKVFKPTAKFPKGRGAEKEAKLKEIWESTKKEARAVFRERIQAEREARRRATIQEDPEWLREGIEDDARESLTKSYDDEIIGIKEELREQGYSEEAITERMDEIGKRLADEEIPPEPTIKEALASETPVAEPLEVEPTAGKAIEAIKKAQTALAPVDEPAKLTQEEFVDSRSQGPMALDVFDAKQIHKDEVARAVAKGEKVSPEVLKDYPELKPSGAQPVEPVISPTDLNYDLAERAHSGTSWTPDVRAKSEQTEYVREMTAVWEGIKKLAKTPEDMTLAISEFDRYKQEWLRRYSEVLRSRSGLVSSMIAGPSKFPTERMNKKNDVHSRKVDEFLEWDKKVQKSMRDKVSHKPPRAISSDREDAVETLNAKIKDAEAQQERMKAVNAIIRAKLTDAEKVDRITKEIGLSETVAYKLLQPDFAGRKGFPQYETTNNAANIRRMKDRVEELTREKAKPAMEAEFDGGRIEENLDNNRIQIFFDAKPDRAMIEKLKSNGFHWSPREGAWQRLKNANARAAVERLFGEKLKGAKIPEEEKVVEFNPTEYETETRAPEVGQTLKATPEGILNNAGRPIPLYHGTKADVDITNIQPGEGGAAGPGIYLSKTPDLASLWAGEREGARVLKLYATGKYLKLPYDEAINAPKWAEKARQEGYAGLDTGLGEVVVFDKRNLTEKPPAEPEDIRLRKAPTAELQKQLEDRLMTDLNNAEFALQEATQNMRSDVVKQEWRDEIEKIKAQLKTIADIKEEIKAPLPAPSPTRPGEQLLPGMKVGLEMAGAKEGAAPTLEGSPLMEAARKAETERVQPGLFAEGDRTQQLDRGISDGEMRLRSGVNALGEKLSPLEMEAIRKSVEAAKAEKEAMPEAPQMRASLADFQADPVKFMPDDLMVDAKAIREKTGKEITMKQNAKEAYTEITDRLKTFRDFWNCVKS